MSFEQDPRYEEPALADRKLIEPTEGFDVVGYTTDALNSPIYKNCIPFAVDQPESQTTRRLRAQQLINMHPNADAARDYFLNVPNVIWELGYHTKYEGIVIPNQDNPTQWDHFDVFTSKGSHVQIKSFLDRNNAQARKKLLETFTRFDTYVLRDSFTRKLLLVTIFRNRFDQDTLLYPPEIESEAAVRRTNPSYYSFYKFTDHALLIPNTHIPELD